MTRQGKKSKRNYIFVRKQINRWVLFGHARVENLAFMSLVTDKYS